MACKTVGQSHEMYSILSFRPDEPILYSPMFCCDSIMFKENIMFYKMACKRQRLKLSIEYGTIKS